MPPGSGSDPPLGLLVSKLLAALAASEKFVVQLNPISALPSLGALYGGGYRGGLQRELGVRVRSLAALACWRRPASPCC